jgi:hypothetical protein
MQIARVQRIVEMDVVDGDQVVTRIMGDGSWPALALLVCDFVRHLALMHKVDEDAVWEWVDRERYHHTTEIVQPS